ncbi:hypothetical protein WISP_38606 [Willisornis vidua]|uniref:Uncharacterized protein n=1 Tax=Willisornis vidua TaxID=1566151 RepID=A0ABQ9DKL5_9PASS|nr:hypothetical protein WISP_38606 [Willisornis vidua]
MHQHGLRANLLSRSAEEDVGALVDNKLSIHQQCAPMAKKAKGILMTMHWNRLPKEVVKILPLDIFKNCLDIILCNVL